MKSITILTLGMLLFLCSCVKEELPHQNNVAEGEPALVSLKMNMATMGSKRKTRAMTPEKENEIADLRILIFDSADKIITNRKYLGNKTTIDVETYSGNNRKIYVVANAVEAVDKRLSFVTNLTEFLAVQATDAELGYGLDVDKPLMMTGESETVNIQPRDAGKNTIPAIQLKFLAAKLTLTVEDATPEGQNVTILDWDVVDVAKNTFVYPGSNDANVGLEDDPNEWLTSDGYYPFNTTESEPKTGKIDIYLTENRRGGRVDRALPDDPAKRYRGMSFTDTDHRGKGWFKPQRATAILIRAMHQTAAETKQINAYIYLGGDNYGNYDIERGNHYTFTVTVKGLNDINVDSSVDYVEGNFTVDHGANLTMDAHPDFRPMRIHATEGTASIEIVDETGKTHNEPGFSATWLKISPLNLMYHQVKQSAPNDKWQQQAGDVGSFVRAKYIPHKSVRTQLATKGGWNEIPAGKEDDDEMTFGDATYRMCYKITDIPFKGVTAVTDMTLCVYADEFLSNGGTRTAKVKVTFLKTADNPEKTETKTFNITQNGYLTPYDMDNSNAGLYVLNQDGTPSDVKKKFIIEQYEEVAMILNPGVPPIVQMTNSMQWGFYGVELYNNADKYRNGYFLTANAVYTDVNRVSNQPTGFGIGTNSYRPMYGNNKTGGSTPIVNYGGTTAAPYYYPAATDVIYHPIYKSSAARYCHEKNRDINGDGYIDASETHWYLPSQHELQMIWITGMQRTFVANVYWSATENISTSSWYVTFTNGTTASTNKANTNRVRCVRDL